MNGFQILAVILLGPSCLWVLYSGIHQARLKQVLLALVLGIGILFILRPDLAQRIAQLLGISRGADLVAYFTTIAVLGCYFLVFGIERRMRIQITELTRAIALMQSDIDLTSQRPLKASPGPGASSMSTSEK